MDEEVLREDEKKEGGEGGNVRGFRCARYVCQRIVFIRIVLYSKKG